MVQLPQGGAKLGGGQQTGIEGLSQFIQIYHFDTAVRIDDNIGQQVRGGQSMGLFIVGILYYIAVPVQQRTVLAVKFADLEPFLKKIAGAAVAERYFGI